MRKLMIYKILRKNEWLDLKSQGSTSGAVIDVQDGFIHFSTASQVVETVEKYFKGLDDLFIAAVDDSKIGDELIWEPARKNQLFPHLYRKLNLTEIIWCKALKLRNGKHLLPSKMI